MKCLQCGAKLTKENRQKFRKGFGWLPYCKGCTDAYNEKDEEEQIEDSLSYEITEKVVNKIRRMSAKKRAKLHKKLVKQGHKPEAINEAWRRMGIIK